MSGYQEKHLTEGQSDGRRDDGNFMRPSVYGSPIYPEYYETTYEVYVLHKLENIIYMHLKSSY